ncbi:MAG: trk system potassium uptake protein TrkA [Spirochaetes bacterium]|nr:MAG: trk system potassium uptake protein TrkA [Spirochaetota bacterium]
MRNYAFIGLGSLGMSILERVAETTDRIVVIDKDPILIDRVKDLVRSAFVADVLDSEALERILPEEVDVAIVDLASNIEAALLATHRLRKLGVKEIIVKSESDERSEVLKLVGATRVVNSDREAAARITPLILSSSLYNFMPIGGDLVMAEVLTPAAYVGKTLLESELRRHRGVNVVAVRAENSEVFKNIDRDYKLLDYDHLLVAGKEDDVFAFSDVMTRTEKSGKQRTITTIFKTLFKSVKKRKELP